MIYFSIMSYLLFIISSTEAPFTLFLSVDGDSFYPMEPIYTKLVIKNTSNTVQKIVDVRGPGSQIDFLQYIIVSENGDTMPGLGQYLDYFPSILQLKPGDSIVCEMSLLERYGKRRQKDLDGFDIALWFIPPGRYTAAVRYEVKKDSWLKKECWRGAIESNKIDFVVNLPEELKEPFNSYAKIWTLAYDYKYNNVKLNRQRAWELTEALINSFLTTYEVTPYHPAVYLFLATTYMHYEIFENKPEYREKRISILKELFTKFPNSKISQRHLDDLGELLRKDNRQSEWLLYLNQLTERYPETRVGYEARKLLEEERQLQR